MAPEDDMPPDPFPHLGIPDMPSLGANPTAALESMAHNMVASMKPLMLPRIREALERNEKLVSQDNAALTHLSNEIFDSMFALPEG